MDVLEYEESRIAAKRHERVEEQSNCRGKGRDEQGSYRVGKLGAVARSRAQCPLKYRYMTHPSIGGANVKSLACHCMDVGKETRRTVISKRTSALGLRDKLHMHGIGNGWIAPCTGT